MQQAAKGFRLSPEQTRLWSLQQRNNAYRAYCSLLITGELCVSTLQRTLENIFSRHEIYRTSFPLVQDGNLPLQVVRTHPHYLWRQVDLRDSAPREQRQVIEVCSDPHQGFTIDVDQGPLLSCILFTLGERHYCLSISLYALHADRGTLHQLVEEIATCYRASGTDEQGDAEGQYTQFSEWQNSLLEEAEALLERAYWREKEFPDISAMILPFERPPDARRGFAPARLSFPIEPVISSRLSVRVEQHQQSLASFFLACWSILLWRLTGQDEFFIGLEVDGRIYEELASVAGPLSKTMPLSCHLFVQPFDELWTALEEACDELVAHYPYFTRQHLDKTPDTDDQAALYLFGFDFREEPELPATEIVSFLMQQCYSYSEPFKLKLVVVQNARGGLVAEFHYDSSFLGNQEVQRIAHYFSTLLESVLHRPTATIETLTVLSAVEREQLLTEFNQTSAGFLIAEDQCLHQLFEQQAMRTPDALAVADGEHVLSYQLLDERANQIAHQLRILGVGPEVLVGIFLPRSLDVLIGVLGILKAGGCYVPLDLASPEGRLNLVIDEAQLKVVLTRSEHLQRLPRIKRVLCLDTDWPDIAQQRENAAFPDGVSTLNLAYVLYTSGSTGRPKGVMIPHRGVVHYLRWCSLHYQVAAGTGSPVHSSLAFDLTVTSLFAPLLVGRCVVMVPEVPGVDALGSLLRGRQGFSLVKITPAHLDLLSQYLTIEELAEAGNVLVIGGEALHSESLVLWRQHATNTRLINEYGPTETVVGCCIYEVTDVDTTTGTVPIGRPIPNTQVYLLDTTLRPVPLGVVGELYIGGIGLGRGYLYRPDLTAERFMPHPFSTEPGARIYKTGDLARYISTDGTLEYLGRVDQQIKLRGYRIELGEIEAALRSHPNVQDGVVILRENGERGPHLVGYVLARKQPLPTSIELRDFLSERVPEYMLPSAFVLLTSLPLTANGKVDRRRLIGTYASEVDRLSSETKALIQPRDLAEFQLLRIWEDVLQIRPISVVDNFFALGGHSLLAVRLMSRIFQQFGRDLALTILFQYPTIADLAIVLRQQLEEKVRSALVAIQTQGSKPAFFCVHSSDGHVFSYINLARYLGDDQPFYGLQSSQGAVLTTIEDMASRYIAELLALQPQGPYLLGGWSTGGVVALEMAQQLTRQGREVALLAIIDSVIADDDMRARAMEEHGDPTDVEVVDGLLQRFHLPVPAHFEQLEIEKQINYVLEKTHEMQYMPADVGFEQIRQIYRTAAVHRRLAHRYVPQPYNGHIDYFFAAGDTRQAELAKNVEGVTEILATAEELAIWNDLAGGDIDIHPIPGDHFAMIEEPLVQALAASLKQCIVRSYDLSAHEV